MDQTAPVGAQGILFEVPKPERKMGPIERAVVKGDDAEAISQVLIKCSRILDECESGRDVKALSITIIDGIAKRRELLDATDRTETGPTPVEIARSKRAALHG